MSSSVRNDATSVATSSWVEDSGLDIDGINDALGTIVDNKEVEIDGYLDGTSDLDDSATVLALQQLMNEWSFLIGMQSSMIKSISDAMKSMVQKIQ